MALNNQYETEIEYFKNHINPDDFNVIKNTTKLQTMTIKLRKCLMLKIEINLDTYPKERSVSATLHSFDLSNLKSMREETISCFINQVNHELNSQDSDSLVSLFKKAKELLENSSHQEYLHQTFDILESSPSKYHLFKFELNENHESCQNQASKNEKGKKFSKIEPENERKPKFKGSELIFDRIKWDNKIDKEQIIIGYLDRFKGVQEIKFNDFKGVHDDLYGIPQHRIRYFKINDQIVWDRENKIDLLTDGDYQKYFLKKQETLSSKPISTEQEIESIILQYNEKIANDGLVLKFKSTNWLPEREGNPNSVFMDSFKIITYNIMSKNNLHRGIKETMKRAKHSAGLEPLSQIDRMKKVVELLETNKPDFILLQECENHEETKLKEDKFIQNNYFLCTTENLEASSVILSKIKPVWFKTLKLCENSMKIALVAKYRIKTNSLRRIEELIIVNIHLTSGHANNFFQKRRSQLETLKRCFLDEPEKYDFNADYLMIAGDFNFGEEDENKSENDLLKEFFILNGFTDLVPNVKTFDPHTNLSASITSHKDYSRRLDRLLFKSKDSSKFEMMQSNVVYNLPFEIFLEDYHPISFEPYLNVLSLIANDEKKYYLHPSDHFGLECSIKFKASLHHSNLSHQSTLAVLLPRHVTETIQEIRSEHDPQYTRWPPHFNLLYPFFLEIDFNVDKEENHLIGDIMDRMTRFEPFKCEINQMKAFDKNNVVYLEPCRTSQQQMKDIFKELKNLFEDSANKKWKETLTPHLTISQPTDKRNAPKKWAQDKYETLKSKFPNLQCSFSIDCVYWMTRTDESPFEIRYAFPLGSRYPSTIINLNPKDLYSSEENVLKFLFEKKMILTEEDEKNIDSVYSNILKEIRDSVKDSNVEDIILNGSYAFGIKCNDLDFCLVRSKLDSGELEFSSGLTFNLAQNSNAFNIVRNITDANVPIIELCLTKNKTLINNADIQIYNLPDTNVRKHMFDNFEFMQNVDSHFKEYHLVFPVSGIFENQNLKKYIRNYKDFQIVLSFVKHWSKMRNIYGKAFGFLGGISWAILVAKFLNLSEENFKHELEIDFSAKRYERLLYAFYEYFSKNKHEAVSLIDKNKVLSKSKYKHERCSIQILQSVYPYHNTARNVNDQNRSIIFEEIDRAHDLLKNKSSIETLCQRLNIKEFLYSISFRIEIKIEDNISHIFALIKAKIQALITNIQRVFNGQRIRAFTDLIETNDNSNIKYNNSYFYFIGLPYQLNSNESNKQVITDCCNNFIQSIKSLSHTSEFEISLVLKL